MIHSRFNHTTGRPTPDGDVWFKVTVKHQPRPPETVAHYAQQVSKAQMAVFAQSAHVAHLEETEAFLREIASFLHC